jgi:hypothetical protein
MGRALGLAIAVTSYAVLSLCRETAARADECTRDKDCPGQHVCSEGQCKDESSEPPGRVCEIASDCPPDQTCHEGRCAIGRRDAEAAETQSPAEASAIGQAGQSPPEDRGPAGTLLTAGIVSLGVGYGIAFVGGAISTGVAISQTSQYRASCLAAGPLNFIPLAGPWMYAASYPDHQLAGYGAGSAEVLDCNGFRGVNTGIVVTSEILQLGGAALIGASFLFKALTTVPVGTTGSLHLLPGGLATPAGLTIELDAP